MIRYLLPLGVFLALVALLAVGLTRNPGLLPSPLIGKPTPDFTLPTLARPDRKLTRADLLGKVTLLNVWASWCVSCRDEHPVLMDISRSSGIALYGLDYKDTREAALRWLSERGNPYVLTLFDADGRVGINFGVYGVPETFVLDRNGVIAYKHVGPITPESWRDKILPVVQKLKREEG